AYRHAFHAGNHADVLKHLTLVAALDLMQKKDVPLWVIDTHAGAGLYSLNSPLVRDKAEWSSGIGRLWKAGTLPDGFARYLDLVRSFNPKGKLSCYPGSPLLIERMLRPEDRLRAFEMHPSDIGPLQRSLGGGLRQVKAERKDGFAQLKALLPPPSRRGLILIDPPYEMRDDYRHVIQSLRDALARFANGVYLLWYPKIGRYQVERLLRQIAGLPIQQLLHLRLTVRAPLRDGLGLTGSGMIVINPPYGLVQVMDQLMPVLVEHLGQDNRARGEVRQAEGPAEIKTALSPGGLSAASGKK
ncbi:MAG: 23S rRNA (adenine(2030)-N(6))-methyltransferase RlmJ, partial [Betaproteobacteria bacterium]|nr:23S rRNA (adenine(2030)-N(6))-methyltransferase RlmJ [Betaproteobacteria bacterium]